MRIMPKVNKQNEMGYDKTTETVIILLDAVSQILKAIRKLCGLKRKGKSSEDSNSTDN